MKPITHSIILQYIDGHSININLTNSEKVHKTVSFKYAMNYINLQHVNNQSHVNNIYKYYIFQHMYIVRKAYNLYMRFSTTSMTNLTNTKKKNRETGFSKAENQCCTK